MFTVTKRFTDYPAAHRQPKHDGHCRLIHGHNWSFDITFVCQDLDACGFVLDVGKLQEVKAWLTSYFDHTLLLNTDDPGFGELHSALSSHFAKIMTVPNCGMEGLAEFVAVMVDRVLENGSFADDYRSRGLRVQSVVCWEDSKNKATYTVS